MSLRKRNLKFSKKFYPLRCHRAALGGATSTKRANPILIMVTRYACCSVTYGLPTLPPASALSEAIFSVRIIVLNLSKGEKSGAIVFAVSITPMARS